MICTLLVRLDHLYESQPACGALACKVLGGKVEDTWVAGLCKAWLAVSKLGREHLDVQVGGTAEVRVARHIVQVAVRWVEHIFKVLLILEHKF